MQYYVLMYAIHPTSADAGQIFHLVNPRVMLQQLHRYEVLIANAAREPGFSYDFRY